MIWVGVGLFVTGVALWAYNRIKQRRAEAKMDRAMQLLRKRWGYED